MSEATPRPTPPPGATAVPGLTTCRDALHDVVPVVVGYLTLGTAAGTLLVAQGLSWWWAPVWSLVIYSGTMQMVLVPLAATGEPLAAIALSTVFVSGRHVFYGLGFPLQRVRARRGWRAYAVHAITDEVFALLSSKDEGSMSSRYVLTVEAAAQVSWLLGTTAGALVGLGLAGLLGQRVTLLGFVLTALFVVLAIENWHHHPDLAVLLVGVAAGGGGVLVGGSAPLLVSLALLALGLSLLYLYRRRQAPPPGAPEDVEDLDGTGGGASAQ